MREAISKRISRRTFENEPINNVMLRGIDTWINELNEKSGLTICLDNNGNSAFQSLKASYGMFKNVRTVILMKGKKTDPHLDEKIGYYGEELVLNITDLGLGSCWVGGTFDANTFEIDKDNEKLVCVIVIGVIKAITLKEKVIRSATHRKIKSMEERLVSSDPLPQWVRSGMEAVLLAPSAMNTQKPTFIFKDNELSAEISNDYRFDLVDLGIAKKHFELEAGGTFEFGIGGKFKHNED